MPVTMNLRKDRATEGQPRGVGCAPDSFHERTTLGTEQPHSAAKRAAGGLTCLLLALRPMAGRVLRDLRRIMRERDVNSVAGDGKESPTKDVIRLRREPACGTTRLDSRCMLRAGARHGVTASNAVADCADSLTSTRSNLEEPRDDFNVDCAAVS